MRVHKLFCLCFLLTQISFAQEREKIHIEGFDQFQSGSNQTRCEKTWEDGRKVLSEMINSFRARNLTVPETLHHPAKPLHFKLQTDFQTTTINSLFQTFVRLPAGNHWIHPLWPIAIDVKSVDIGYFCADFNPKIGFSQLKIFFYRTRNIDRFSEASFSQKINRVLPLIPSSPKVRDSLPRLSFRPLDRVAETPNWILEKLFPSFNRMRVVSAIEAPVREIGRTIDFIYSYGVEQLVFDEERIQVVIASKATGIDADKRLIIIPQKNPWIKELIEIQRP